jgi:hypothetical protein
MQLDIYVVGESNRLTSEKVILRLCSMTALISPRFQVGVKALLTLLA